MKRFLKSGFIFSISSVLVFLAVLFLLNNVKVKKTLNKSIANFDIQKISKKRVHKNKKKRAQRKKSQKQKIKALRPNINNVLSSSGIDLGLNIVDLAGQESGLLNANENTVMTEDVVDVPPVLGTQEPIEFPDAAKEAGVNGFVQLQLLINRRGVVEKIKILQSQPAGYFEDVAMRGVKKWLFQPAQFQGKKVAVWVKQKIAFNAD